MIPRASVLRDVPCVGEGIKWCDRTLRDAVDTIHVHCLVLPDTVPVDARAVVCQIVDHGDTDNLHATLAFTLGLFFACYQFQKGTHIAPACLYPRTRIHVVEELCISKLHAICIN